MIYKNMKYKRWKESIWTFMFMSFYKSSPLWSVHYNAAISNLTYLMITFISSIDLVVLHWINADALV